MLFRNLSLGALGFRVPLQKTVEAAKIGGFQGVDIDIVEIDKTLESKPIDEVKNLVQESKAWWFGQIPLGCNQAVAFRKVMAFQRLKSRFSIEFLISFT